MLAVTPLEVLDRVRKAPATAATPRDVLFRDGTASLYRFRGSRAPLPDRLPVLLVPSMINRWYVLDLRPGSSVAEALVEGGLDVFCLDWGIPEDEDRYMTWDEVVERLDRFARRVRRITGAPELGVLGYCMGATLSGIYTALKGAAGVRTLVNLAGPFDFSEAGLLGTMVDPRWFDPAAMTAPGNLSPTQMQSGFVALRPPAQLAKWVGLIDKHDDDEALDAIHALETWASDNIPFPATAYVTYIKELYQENRLVKGEHRVGGEAVDLGRITCPVLTVATDRDTICPLGAARALHDRTKSPANELFVVSGGHVGAVVGSKARKVLYPKLVSWFRQHLLVEAPPNPGPAKKEAAPPNPAPAKKKARSTPDSTPS